MNYIDIKYVGILGQQLRNFKKKKNNLFNCSCPICGDSAKKKTKARGYFYIYENSMFYKCHNCHASMSLAFLLKTHFSSLYDLYSIERFSDCDERPKRISLTRPKQFCEVQENKISLDEFATSILNLPEQHYAKQYVLGRKLPERTHSNIYFSEDFAKLIKDVFPKVDKNLAANDKRLIIPFYDKDKNIIAIQGRSLVFDSQLRYITIKANESESLLYGMERFDSSSDGYVVEGPIDSLFLSNCLATANSNLEHACQAVKDSLTLIFDNEPKNKEIVSLMNKAIANKRSICIWPNNIQQKDINDMILSGIDSAQLTDIIKKRTFTGLNAMLEFNQWKKV